MQAVKYKKERTTEFKVDGWGRKKKQKTKKNNNNLKFNYCGWLLEYEVMETSAGKPWREQDCCAQDDNVLLHKSKRLISKFWIHSRN